MKRDEYYDLEGVVEFTKLKASYIYKLTSQGKIPHEKIGGELLFSKKDIAQWNIKRRKRGRGKVTLEEALSNQ